MVRPSIHVLFIFLAYLGLIIENLCYLLTLAERHFVVLSHPEQTASPQAVGPVLVVVSQGQHAGVE